MTLSTTLPPGFEVVDMQIRSHPDGANSGTAFRDGRQIVFAIGRVEHDTEVEIEVRVVATRPGTYISRWITRSIYRPIFECTTPFTFDGSGCAQPRLEVRHGLSGQPEFRVEDAVGSLTLEVSEDLVRWTPSSTVSAGTWLAIPIPTSEASAEQRQFFLRIVR